MEADVTVRYDMIRVLGEGVYGDVRLAIDKETGELVAIKRMSKISKYETGRAFQREVEAGRILKHPGVVQIRDSFETQDDYYLVMEYLQGKDLVDYMEKYANHLSESTVKRIFYQLLNTVHYIHQQGICHRDIKLENIMLDGNGNIKLIDFGLCNLEDSENCLGRVGSPEYCCPEIVDPDYGEYSGYVADAWSCGITLYALLNGRFPFDEDQLSSIADGDYVPLTWTRTVSPQAQDLVEALLDPNPETRMTIEQALRHCWFADIHLEAPSSSAAV